ncbi:hypothetical protein ALC57_04811 [Trachymyrmex cornetzi]|uniref:Uncharacterized protein n=1 Tax=Trachymyrmex cornetzi TaxID=471704 RepID=A0A195EDZ9_9HYME|nr:hypothetical protein ALC57_04811 [Trachymyrmex cornetzi]
MSEESRRPSKVERNRDLASPPDTLHATRETWNDFERRVSSFALPLEPCPLDAARPQMGNSLGNNLRCDATYRRKADKRIWEDGQGRCNEKRYLRIS